MTPKERRTVKKLIETEGLDYFLQEHYMDAVKDQELYDLIVKYNDTRQSIVEFLSKEKVYT